jgi:hypothetical protein|tara:strand:- start:67 stop:282 length:216 start_codon:yes stop_codon:yes gene_type:complete
LIRLVLAAVPATIRRARPAARVVAVVVQVDMEVLSALVLADKVIMVALVLIMVLVVAEVKIPSVVMEVEMV